MKEAKRIYGEEIALAICAGAVALIMFAIFERLWLYDLKVPFVYEGDALGIQTYIKCWIDGEKWSATTLGGAPFTNNRWTALMDGPIFLIPMYVLARVTKCVGYTINFTFIFTYFLSAVCTYYFLRKNRVSRLLSVLGGVVYAFIPGHYLRNISHLMVGSVFLIPLFVQSTIELAQGLMCKEEYVEKKRLSFGQLFCSMDKNVFKATLNIFLISMSTLYYGFFSLLLIVFASIYAAVKTGKARQLFYGFFLILQNFIFIVALYIPQLAQDVSDKVSTTYVSRYTYDLDAYGLKIAQLILPIQGHRIAAFRHLKELYDNAYGFSETSWSSLGLIMSIGLIVSMLFIILPHKDNDQVRLLGSFNLFMILVGTIGGGASIIGLFFYSIRCYNRLSYFIGAYSLLGSMILFDKLVCGVNQKYKNLVVVLLIGICFLGVLDEVPAQKYRQTSPNQNNTASYYEDELFVNQIESYEGTGAMIMLFPLNSSLLGGCESSTEGGYLGYRQARMPLHAHTSRWNIGMGLEMGGIGDQWMASVNDMQFTDQLKMLVAAGYDGIVLYSDGYDEEKYETMKNNLEKYIGNPVCTSTDGKWKYYSLGEVKNAIKKQYSENEWIKWEKVALGVLKYHSWDKNNLYGTEGDTTMLEDGIELAFNGTQYGPYKELKSGKYNVRVEGENLSQGMYRASCYEGEDNIEVADVEISDHVVTYTINVKQNVSGVEFKATDITDDGENIIIYRIQCYGDDAETRNYVENYLNQVQLN